MSSKEDEMTVWVLFHETNTGHTEESDGYVEAVYKTKALADAAMLAAIRKARDDGESIWWDPDDPDVDGPADWEHDWRVEGHDVLTAVEPKLVVVHFAAGDASQQRVGPAWCRAGRGFGSEFAQRVSGSMDQVTCLRCIRKVAAYDKQKDQQ